MAQVAHYIHLNPVRAGIVSPERLLDYRASSLPYLVGANRPSSLSAETVLAESGGLKDSVAGWRNYQAYLGVLAEEDLKRREERFGRLSRGWMVGSEEFRTALKKDLAAVAGEFERVQLNGGDRSAHRELREQLWEQKLQKLAQLFNTSLAKLPEARSAAVKVQLAAAMKATTSVSNGWLAERLAMGQPASVSQYVRRHRLCGHANSPQFRAVLSKVKS